MKGNRIFNEGDHLKRVVGRLMTILYLIILFSLTYSKPNNTTKKHKTFVIETEKGLHEARSTETHDGHGMNHPDVVNGGKTSSLSG